MAGDAREDAVPVVAAEQDETLVRLLGDVRELFAAADERHVLRAGVEAGCRATGSPRGLAGLVDGDAAISEAWYDAAQGWTGARARWDLATSAPGTVCASGAPFIRGTGGGPVSGEEAADPPEFPGAERLLCVPLPGPTAPLGFLAAGGRAEDYAQRDLDVLGRLAALIALRLREVAGERRRFAEDCATQADIADRLQRRLLPGEPPVLDGLDVAFAYRSSSAGVLSGGDFVDYYSRSPGALAFAIGDVAGKGVEAMAVTFMTKYILRAAVHGGQLSWPTNPGEALQELRTGLLEQPDFAADSERFVTVLFGLVSRPRGLLQLASAGHPTPFIIRKSGVERPLLITEPAIGVELGAALAPYPTETVALRHGDVVVAFTDGLTELRDARDGFFEDRMGEALAGCHDMPAAQVVAQLLAAGDAYSARPAGDDLAVLCIRLTAEPGVN